MTLEVFDYRTDIRNIFIAPEMRARIIRREPGTSGGGHTHDLGHEIFLVLEGQAEFTIAGESAILGPGQLCIARADEWHTIRVVGETPLTYYLSVTPHLEPTHTQWDHEGGTKLPYQYGGSTRDERRARTTPPEPPETLLARHLVAAHALADAAAMNAAAQDEAGTALREALSAGNNAAAKEAIDAMWRAISTTYKQLQAMEIAWNALAPAIAGE
ncbi:MAG: cupin domain-containing protein [Thermomicrobia bacterium]|nr:cupin domain-containing protein [Thermomicrobia bacterium]